MRILGIDPGLANTGYGVIEHTGQSSRMMTSGCIRTEAHEPLPQRLAKIHDTLVAVIDEWSPEVVCLEDLFFCKNVKTAMAVAQGRGVCILAASKARLEVAEYTPLQIKLAVVGYGKASKQQVEKMVKVLLGLSEIPSTNHAADALAVALCHAHSYHLAGLVQKALAK